MALRLGQVVEDEQGRKYQVISKAAPSGYWAKQSRGGYVKGRVERCD